VKPVYHWNGTPLDPRLLIHVKGFTYPGSVLGLSPLALFKVQIETGLSAQAYTRDWFDNGASPSGHMKNTAQTLTDDESKKLKDRFKVATANRDVLVTGNDWDWTALGVPADQAKFLETIQSTANQIAAVYRASAEDVGGTTSDSLTYKTLLQDQQRLSQWALRPWASGFEGVLTNLLTHTAYARFDLNANAQGTVLERMQAHKAAMEIGVETQAEARTAEDRAPLTDAESAAWLAYIAKQPPAGGMG
jgi:HK97 family phage portal protein